MKVQPADPRRKALHGCEWASIVSLDAFCSRCAAAGLHASRGVCMAHCKVPHHETSPQRHAFIGSLLEGCTRVGIEDVYRRFGLFGFIETDLIL